MDDQESKNINEIKQKLGSLLSKCKIDKEDRNSKISHTIFGPPYGKYYISDNQLDEFSELYSQLIKSNMSLHFIERPNNIAPLCLDFDFKFEKQHKKRQYTEDTVKSVIQRVTNRIKEYVDIKHKKQLESYVFEKPKPTEEDKETYRYKDGFHIMYPHLPLDRFMRYFIIDIAREDVIEHKDFKNVPYCNDINDVFDTSVVINNGWTMYGSKKHNCQKYVLTSIYNNECTKLPDKKLNKFLQSDSICKTFSVRKFGEDDVAELTKVTESFDFKQRMDSVITKYEGKRKKKLDGVSQQLEQKYDLIDDNSENSDDEIDMLDERPIKRKELSTDQHEYVKKLVKLLSIERATTYQTWIYVCWCLKNISQSLVDVWLEFSKRCPSKYNKAECMTRWKEAYEGEMGIGTLCYWAKNDDLAGYTELVRQNVKLILQEAESGTHYDIAKVVYEMYKHQFRCVSIKKEIWYEFQHHRWVMIENGYTLNNIISEELTVEFMHLNHWYIADALRKSATERDACNRRSEKILRLMNELKKSPFKRSVMEQCSHLFYETDFEEKLNRNKDLLGFDNGIYDLKAACFRAGLPDDYLTYTTKYNYKEYNMNHKYIKCVEQFFRKVQPEDEMYDYLLTLLASHLDGHNKQQRFVFFTGFGGSNGKSTACDFLQMTLGDYASTVKPTIFTRKEKGAGDASPELADKNGVRFLQLDEPDESERIHVGQLKRLSGNDKIQARALYQDIFYYKPQFKMIMLCNKLPHIEAIDGGTWRRIRVTPWDSKFVDFDEKIEDAVYEHFKDPDIEAKMDKWKKAFIWLLINKYYPIYRKHGGVPEPLKVKQYSDDYHKSSDIYFEFIAEHLEITEKPSDWERTTDIYDNFRSWYKQSYTGGSAPSLKDFRSYMMKSKYKVKEKGTRMFGLKIKTDDYDFDEKFDEL